MIGLNKNLLTAMAGVTEFATNPAVAGTGIALGAGSLIYKLIKDTKESNEDLLKTNSLKFSQVGREKKDLTIINRIAFNNPIERLKLQYLSGIYYNSQREIDVPDTSKGLKDSRTMWQKTKYQLYDKSPLYQLYRWIKTGQSPSAIKEMYGPPKIKKERKETEERASILGINVKASQLLGLSGYDILRRSGNSSLSMAAATFDMIKIVAENTIAMRIGQGFSMVGPGHMVSKDNIFSKISKIPEAIMNIPGLNAIGNIAKGGFNLLTSPIKLLTNAGAFIEKFEVGWKQFFSKNIFKSQDRADWLEQAGIPQASQTDVRHAELNLAAANFNVQEKQLKTQILMSVALDKIAKIEETNRSYLNRPHKEFNEITAQFVEQDENYYGETVKRALMKIKNKSMLGKISGALRTVTTDLFKSADEAFAAEENRLIKDYGYASNVKEYLKSKGMKKKIFGDNTEYNQEFMKESKRRMNRREERITGIDSVTNIERELEDRTNPVSWRQKILFALGLDDKAREQGKVVLEKLKKQAGREAHLFNTDFETNTEKPVFSSFNVPPYTPKSPETPGLNSYVNLLSEITPDGQLVFTGLQALEYHSINLYSLVNTKIFDSLKDIKNLFQNLYDVVLPRFEKEPIQVFPQQISYTPDKQLYTPNFILVDAINESTEYNKKTSNVLEEIKNQQPTDEQKRYTEIKDDTYKDKMLEASEATRDTLKGKISYYLRDAWEKTKFGKKKEGEDNSNGLFSGIGSLLSSIFGGLLGSGAAGGLLGGGKRLIGKVLGAPLKMLKFGGRLLKKAFLPLTALFAGKDAFDAWGNASDISGSANPSFFEKFGAGVSGLISSLSWGLIEPKTIYDTFSPVAGWIGDKIKNLGEWFSSTQAGTNFKDWKLSDTFKGVENIKKIAGVSLEDASFFQRVGSFSSGILSTLTLGMVKPETFYGYLSETSKWVNDSVSKFGEWFSSTQAGTNFKDWKLVNTLDGFTESGSISIIGKAGKKNSGADGQPSFFQRLGTGYSGILSTLTLGMVKPDTFYGYLDTYGQSISSGIETVVKNTFTGEGMFSPETLQKDARKFSEKTDGILKNSKNPLDWLAAYTGVYLEDHTFGIINAQTFYDDDKKYREQFRNSITGFVGKWTGINTLSDDQIKAIKEETDDKKLRTLTEATGSRFIPQKLEDHGLETGVFKDSNERILPNELQRYKIPQLIPELKENNITKPVDALMIERLKNEVKDEEREKYHKHRIEVENELSREKNRSRYNIGAYEDLKKNDTARKFMGNVVDKVISWFSPSEASASDIIPRKQSRTNFSQPDPSKFNLPKEKSTESSPVIPKTQTDNVPMSTEKMLDSLGDNRPVFKGLTEEQLKGDTVKLGSYNVNTDVYRAIQQASIKHGVPLDYMLAMAAQESGFNPNIKAPTSSATGLYQFISSTWKSMWKGGEVPDPKDPVANADAGARYALQAEKILGTDDPAALYLGHFLGPYGAQKLINALRNDPSTPASKVVGEKQMWANSSIFTPGSSVNDIYNWSKRKMNGFISKLGGSISESDLAKVNQKQTPPSETSPAPPITISETLKLNLPSIDKYLENQPQVPISSSKPMFPSTPSTDKFLANQVPSPRNYDTELLEQKHQLIMKINKQKEKIDEGFSRVDALIKDLNQPQTRSSQNIEPVGKPNLNKEISELKQPKVEEPKETIVGPLVSAAPVQSQVPVIINAPVTNVSSNNTPNNKEKQFDPILASLLDNLFNGAIAGFTNAGRGFVFGEMLNANSVMA